jgi:hypothetical protein
MNKAAYQLIGPPDDAFDLSATQQASLAGRCIPLEKVLEAFNNSLDSVDQQLSLPCEDVRIVISQSALPQPLTILRPWREPGLGSTLRKTSRRLTAAVTAKALNALAFIKKPAIVNESTVRQDNWDRCQTCGRHRDSIVDCCPFCGDVNE